MFDESIVQKRLDRRAVLRIRNKKRGAQNNENGGRFELQIVITFLLHYAVKSLQDRAFLRSLVIQNAQCFVDDVVVQDPRRTIMVQVKHVAKLTWDYPGLKQDFARQHQLRDLLANPLRLFLFVHRADVAAVLKKTADDYGMKYVNVLTTERNRFGEFSLRSARNLCFGKGTETAPHNVIRHLESAWSDLGGAATLGQILAQASANSSGTVRSLAPSGPAAEAVTAALKLIPGLRAEADGSTCFWRSIHPRERSRVSRQT